MGSTGRESDGSDGLRASDRSVRSDRSDGSSSDRSDGSVGCSSVGSDRSDSSVGCRRQHLRPSGGYRRLRSFRTATVVYDATVSFCERFLDKRSRTVDQMVQAARAGRQNIAEGSRASATSSQTELRLVSVARASLDELLLDYEDFLRQHRLLQWAKDDPQAQAVRHVSRNWTNPTDHGGAVAQSDYALYARWLNDRKPEIPANALICLIHQTNYLLDHQISGLEGNFVQEGGYSERLASARIEARRKQQGTPDGKTEDLPRCPTCGGIMALRKARKGKFAGRSFWGCLGYPDCKGTRPASD